MAKAHFLKKIAAVLGLFAITFLSGFAAANLGQKNDGEAAVTTTEKTAVTAVKSAETFSYDCINETVISEGKTLPVKEVERTLDEKEGIAKFAAKAQIGEKTVLLSGEIPTTILEPLVAEFKVVEGTQVTKFPNGFVTATIE